MMNFKRRVLIYLALTFLVQFATNTPTMGTQFTSRRIRYHQAAAIQRLLKEIMDLKLPINSGARVTPMSELSSVQSSLSSSPKSMGTNRFGLQALRPVSRGLGASVCEPNSSDRENSCCRGARSRNVLFGPQVDCSNNKRILFDGYKKQYALDGESRRGELSRMLASFEQLIDQLSESRKKITRGLD